MWLFWPYKVLEDKQLVFFTTPFSSWNPTFFVYFSLLLVERLRDFHFLVLLAHSIVVVHYKVFLKVRQSRYPLLTRGAAAKRLKEHPSNCTAPRYFIEPVSRPPLDYLIWHHMKDCIFDKGQSTHFILGIFHTSKCYFFCKNQNSRYSKWPKLQFLSS